jgi:hypothetical protein
MSTPWHLRLNSTVNPERAQRSHSSAAPREIHEFRRSLRCKADEFLILNVFASVAEFKRDEAQQELRQQTPINVFSCVYRRQSRGPLILTRRQQSKNEYDPRRRLACVFLPMGFGWHSEDPRQCKFDPVSIQCKEGEDTDKLHSDGRQGFSAISDHRKTGRRGMGMVWNGRG